MKDGELIMHQEEEPVPEGCIQELRIKDRILHTLMVVEPTARIGQLVQSKHLSSAQRLFRVTAYVLLAVEKFRKKLRETTTLTVPP